MNMANDTQFEEVTINNVTKSTSGWEIQRSDGWSFFVPADSPVEPQVGHVARFYGRGIGFTVRGLVIDGRTVFYRTVDEQRAKEAEEAVARAMKQQADYEAAKPKNDERIAALPAVLRDRILRFREKTERFGPEFEGYELFCSEQATLIFNALKDEENIKTFAKFDWENQKAAVPELSDGHSGNTFGFAVLLARLLATTPERCADVPGAMSPLVGSDAYERAEKP